MNNKIGKWSLYGTIGGVVILGILITIINEGIVSFITDFIPLIIGVAAFLVILFIISLLPEKWAPILYLVTFLAFIYYMDRSWTFTMSIAILFVLYNLVNKKVKNKRVTKWANILLLGGLLIAFVFR